MAVWTIVPVKPLRLGKSRLGNVLSEENREALNFCLLEQTLETLKSVKQIEQILVVSRDPRVLSLARSLAIRTVHEAGTPELNHALERATMFVRRLAVQSVLIIPADLPLINTMDIEAILELGKKPPVVVISPDRHKKGTNAMFVNPSGLFKYQYGPDSFQKHVELALEKGARIEIFNRQSISLDLDLPDDLALVRKHHELLNQQQMDEILSSKYQKQERVAGPIFDGISPCEELIRSNRFGDAADGTR
jgi:2-phospho-L-lactate guanylyltransferase